MVAISIQITRGLCGYKSPCPQNKPTKPKPNKKLEVLLHRMWPQEELWPCVPKKLGINDWLRKYIRQSIGSFQHSSPLPSTLNLSSPWALLTSLIFWFLYHLSILVTRFLGSLPSWSFVSLFFSLPLSLIHLSSWPAVLLAMFSLSLLGASGCSLLNVYSKNLFLHHTQEWPCPHFYSQRTWFYRQKRS